MAAPDVLPRGRPALIDLAFVPVLVVAIARPLVATRNIRNFVMIAALTVLWLADLAVHLDALGVTPRMEPSRAPPRRRRGGAADDRHDGPHRPDVHEERDRVATVHGRPRLDKAATSRWS